MKKVLYLYVYISLLGIPFVFSSSENYYLSKKCIKNNDQIYEKFKNLIGKINTVCGFKGDATLYHTRIKNRNQFLSPDDSLMIFFQDIKKGNCSYLKSLQSDKTEYIPMTNVQQKDKSNSAMTLPIVILEVKDGKNTLFPCFFQKLSIFGPQKIENVCQTSIFSLYDNDIQDALKAKNLGLGSNWSSKNVFIQNWKRTWSLNNLLFFVKYRDHLCILLKTDKDKMISQMTSNAWSSSFKKKIITAEIIAIISIFIYYLFNGENKNTNDVGVQSN